MLYAANHPCIVKFPQESKGHNSFFKFTVECGAVNQKVRLIKSNCEYESATE